MSCHSQTIRAALGYRFNAFSNVGREILLSKFCYSVRAVFAIDRSEMQIAD